MYEDWAWRAEWLDGPGARDFMGVGWAGVQQFSFHHSLRTLFLSPSLTLIFVNYHNLSLKYNFYSVFLKKTTFNGISSIYGLLTKLVRSRWLFIQLILVKVYGPRLPLGPAWSIKDLSLDFRGNFSPGTRRIVPNGQDSSILLARAANHILPVHGV